MTKFPLPATLPDQIVNCEQLSDLLGTSLPSVRTWLRAGLPTLEAGGRGHQFRLQLSHCYAWVKARSEAADHGANVAADRQRRYRSRQLQGKIIVPVEIDEVDVAQALLDLGLLAPQHEDDRNALKQGLERLLQSALGQRQA